MWGGVKGLGFTLAKRLLSLGAYVTITGRSEEKLIQTVETLDSNRVDFLQWDVCDFKSAGNKIKLLLSKHEYIDGFINNAGVYFSEDSKFIGQSENNWNLTMDTNLKGLHYLCQNEIDYFLKCGGGKIINITSLGGVRAGYTPYDLSKSGANTLTRALAKKYTSRQIIINAIAPGEMPTDMGTLCDIHDNLYYGRQRNQRLTLTEEVAELTAFLLSDSTNNLCGQILCCDGGASLF